MLKNWRDYWVIKRSGLFDPIYYLMNNSDVRRADVDPLMHFVKYGWKEGRNPSENFMTNYYLNAYPDVKYAGINPLFHFIRHGKSEGRRTKEEKEEIYLKPKNISRFNVISKLPSNKINFDGITSYVNSTSIHSSISSICFFSNFFEDACAYLRLLSPAKLLGIKVIEGRVNNQITYPERAKEGDLVFIQRDFPRDLPIYEQVMELARQQHKPVVFDIDDLLFFLPENHPERISHHYTEALLPMLEALTEADFVTVPTPKLRTYLEPYNKNICMLPNYFDDSIWSLRKPILKESAEPIIIGYMGGISHQTDIEFVSPVLEEILKKFPQRVKLVFWGIKPSNKLTAYSQVQWIPAHSYDYPSFAEYFQTQVADIVIAPLVDNVFNNAKSPLKFFEYSSIGAPGVYSNLEPYKQVITHGENGFLATTLDEWQVCIEALIQDAGLRHQLATEAQKTIQDRWLLSQNLEHWRETFEKVGLQANKRGESRSAGLIKFLNQQYYSLIRKKDQEIQVQEAQIQKKDQEIQAMSFELATIKSSVEWKIALVFKKMRAALLPRGSKREQGAKYVYHWLQGEKIKASHQKRMIKDKTIDSIINSKLTACSPFETHRDNIDIIICIHNALDDVRNCLESISQYTTEPYNLILVDDGSDEPTKEFLASFASREPRCKLIRNETAMGYTYAANIGMKESQSPYFVLLNSDTIVGPDWIDRMYRVFLGDEEVGIVGPLSNTASWQSVPELSENGDWAANQLPEGLTVSEMAKNIAKYSGCIFPAVPLLNGFCLMIRKKVIDRIGYFDERTFGQGYGEEDDFNLRAEEAGWKKVIVDDVYVFHAQSRSYSHSQRYELSRLSGEKLRKKHGSEKIAASVAFMNPNRVMEGIRNRARIMTERENYLQLGRSFTGKRVLFVLPIIDAGGGGNVIIDESRAMRNMGVDVQIFNLSEYKAAFLQSYPSLDIPLVFGKFTDLSKISTSYDAIVASANYSVEWLKPLEGKDCTLCYYIQDFEPLMYPENSDNAKQALSTYTMVKNCKLFTKTEWTRRMVLDHTGANSDVIGISVDIDLFRPRDEVPFGSKPINIVAMIRPSSPYRSPTLTLSILKEIEKKYGNKVQIWLFGANDIREIIDQSYLDFHWVQFGKLTQYQVASMLSKADIFTDFSSHQAMGLTALEAMSSGCSVIVPENGGAKEFVHHRKNGLVVDTSDFQSSLLPLEELIEDNNLRTKLQLEGMKDVVNYFPEKAAYNILNCLFK